MSAYVKGAVLEAVKFATSSQQPIFVSGTDWEVHTVLQLTQSRLKLDKQAAHLTLHGCDEHLCRRLHSRNTQGS